MFFLLSNLNALIPFVQLLIHFHGLFYLVVLQKNRLSSMELFLEHCELSLHLVEGNTIIPTGLLLVLLDNAHNPSKVSCFGYIAQSSVTVLSHRDVLSLNSYLG
jgi:hypothetical protein